MATNPSINNITSTRHDGNRLNSTGNTPPQGFNPFDNTHASISLFGDTTYNPFFVHNVVGGSREIITPKSRLLMPTMVAPKMQPFLLHRAFYQIPYSAIQPNTWAKYKVYPLKGDDIPDNAMIGMPYFHVLEVFKKKLIDYHTPQDSDTLFVPYHLYYARLLMTFIRMIDPAGLGRALQCFPVPMDAYKNVGSELLKLVSSQVEKSFSSKKFSYQTLYNDQIELISVDSISKVKQFFADLCDGYVYYQSTGSKNVYLPFVEFISPVLTAVSNYLLDITFAREIPTDWNSLLNNDPTLSYVINIRSLVAYQLAMVQYNSVGYVDDVYDAKTWQENAMGMYLKIIASQGAPGFYYNGTYVIYDVYSYKHITSVVDVMYNTSSITSSNISRFEKILDYFLNLVSFVPVIRYLDYFLGGRLEPLAVGDVTVGNSPNTTVVDLAKQFSLARMLNSVNRVSRNLYDYVRNIFGYQPLNKCPYPYKIAEYVDEFDGNTVSSTGNASAAEGLGSRVLNTDFKSENKQLDFYVDDDSVIIGVMHIDYINTYDSAILRSSFYHDRFDEFQPYMQTIGDQSTYRAELKTVPIGQTNHVFNWQFRNAEYKQRYSYLVGDFDAFARGYALPARFVRANALDSRVLRFTTDEFDDFFATTSLFNSIGWRVMFSSFCNVTTIAPMLAKPKLL